MSRIARIAAALLTMLAVAGVAGGGTLIVLQARNDARAQAGAAAIQQARSIASIVGDAVQSDVRAVSSTTDQPVLGLGIANANFRASFPYLSELLATHPRIGAVGVYDRVGRLVARIPFDKGVAGARFGQQEYYAKARKGSEAHISNLFVQLGKPKVPVIAYSYRIRYRAGVYGVLVGTTPITAFDSLLAQFVPAGSVAHIYNASGELISPSTQASARIYATDPFVGPALRGGSLLRWERHSVIVSVPISGIGWAFVLSQPGGVIDKRSDDLTVRLSLIAGAITLLALIPVLVARRRPE